MPLGRVSVRNRDRVDVQVLNAGVVRRLGFTLAADVWLLGGPTVLPDGGAAAACGAAIRQELLELPTRVVADTLGYHDKTTTWLRYETGRTWSRYAPGDHARSPAGWVPQGTGDS
ncbi:hypothetical protein [Streptomyces mirabilis]|uniref:hypothetical protein n=1 Tax=Streptomyces mirabilis TaxID=68239 RepID=UPI0033E3A019